MVNSFEKIFSLIESIKLTTPNQVILSQKRPRQEIRIDHLQEIGTQYEFPEKTYAYTQLTEQIYLFDKPVAFESFWLRLHQAPQAFSTNEVALRYFKIYNGQKLVAQTHFYFWSDEWFLMTPSS